MNKQSLNRFTMINIYKKGKYYNPASSHYGSGSNVACDRCYKNNIDICIGLEDNDLCLDCIQDINKELKRNVPRYTPIKPLNPTSPMYGPASFTPMIYDEPDKTKSFMIQDQFIPRQRTRMVQRQFKSTMMQNQFMNK